MVFDEFVGNSIRKIAEEYQQFFLVIFRKKVYLVLVYLLWRKNPVKIKYLIINRKNK